MAQTRQRIAVIGAGISGLACAYFLSRAHEVILFEAANYLGGHTNTVDVTLDGLTHPVDTGFLVYNHATYPNLIAFFDELNISSYDTDMSFGVSIDDGALEWAGSSLDTVFAQRSNLFSLPFLSMLMDITRFNKNAQRYLDRTLNSGETLEQLLATERYRAAFQYGYLLPMASSIWSCSVNDILRYPASSFIRFCLNHGLLQITNRPQWKTVQGGGREYVKKIATTLNDYRLNTPVQKVERRSEGVLVTTPKGDELVESVVFATHAPQTLAMLADADNSERAVLAGVRYQLNKAVLHTDIKLLPHSKKVWSAWNYLGGKSKEKQRPVCVSYLLNKLQRLPFTTPVIVTLNPFSLPEPQRVIAEFDYAHPIFDHAAIQTQQKLSSIQGKNRVWFAGAWTGYGFHEDGLKSALRVVNKFGLAPSWMK